MPEKVLIVEGNETLCRLLQKSLRRKGMEAYCFSDTLEAVCLFVQHMAKKSPFLTVYLDCDLPHEKGQQTAQILRSIEREAPKPYALPSLTIIGTTNRPWFGTEDGKRFGMDEVVGRWLELKCRNEEKEVPS